jgi:LysM repeat protein
MEKYYQDRIEPEVEVIHAEEHRSSSVKQNEANRWSFLKKRGLIPYSLAGLGILVLGLMVAAGFFSGKKPEESPEFKALKEEVKKLSAQTDPLKNEIQTLRAEQKVQQEQLTVLKEKVAVLTKKPEGRGTHSAPKKLISYKIKKGDTIQSIAQKYQVQQEDIRRWNHLPPKGRLKPGQKVIIHSSAES